MIYESVTSGTDEDDHHGNDSDSDSDSDSHRLPVVEISLEGIGITVEDFEVILKRLYGYPDIEYEKKKPLTFLKAGDFFDISDLIKTALLFSEHVCAPYCLEFIKIALRTDYGEYSVQCMSDIFDRLEIQTESLQKLFVSNPSFDVFNVTVPTLYTFHLRKAMSICEVIKNLKRNRHWKHNTDAEKILRSTLCKKVEYSKMTQSEFKRILDYRDEEECPYVNSKVLLDCLKSWGKFP
ncbi:unnamed protein product [Ambrosiozyma monospora]|uniref:Unnamed protein product n=1 Tax=Ambrosiozyma monospora TaxID=43982 RepID=A0A9W7DGS2_AMBMO|nr:unnamed protein product [Ambrosiozyma monospora]